MDKDQQIRVYLGEYVQKISQLTGIVSCNRMDYGEYCTRLHALEDEYVDKIMALDF